MFNRFLLVLACVFMLVPSASAQSINVQKLGKADPGYTMDLTATYPAGVYYIGDALLSAHIKFDKASAFVGKLFGCAVKNADADRNNSVDTTANCVELANLASTGTFSHTSAHNYYVLDVDTPETGVNVSRLTIRGGNTAGGGGGVLGEGPLTAMNAVTATPGDLWLRDDAGASFNCTSESGANDVLCMYTDAGAWANAGNAGSGDNLGSGVATTDVDLAQNDLLNVAKVDIDPPVNTASVNAPSNETNEGGNVYFAIDGAKNLCTDLYSTGGPPQTSGSPDGFCDSDGVTKAGKTKVYGENTTIVNLTQTEAYAKHVEIICGGDSDCVGQETYVRANGGAQDQGDEGAQVGRDFVTDSYYAVEGTISGTLAAGSGAATITIGGSSLSFTESQMAGENKLLVFHNNNSAGAVAQDVDIAADGLPPGTINASGVEMAGWTTGQKVWRLEDGIVASSGVGPGWAFASKDSAYQDYNGVTSYMWLPIVASDGSPVGYDTITTSIMIQGTDHGLPRGYLAAIGTDEGRIAPFVFIDKPTLNASKVATAIDVIRPTGFDGTASGAAFVVSEYPNQLLLGRRTQIQQVHGSGERASGYQATNLLTPGPGRYQANAGLQVGWSASSGRPGTHLKDGTKHGFKYGVECLAGGCENGLRFVAEPDPDDLFGLLYNQFPLLLSWSSEDWLDNIDRIVARIENSTAHSLTLHPTNGWGQNGDAFLRSTVTDDSINAGVPNGTGAKVHWSQLLGVPSGFADGVDGSYSDGIATTGSVFASFEGTTVDSNEFVIALQDDDPSADITWYQPDASSLIIFPTGVKTLMTVEGSETLTNKTITAPLISGSMDMNIGPVNDDDCTGDQGEWWYDTTDSAFEWCPANSGVPSVLGAGSSIFDTSGIYATTTEDLLIGGDGDNTPEAGEVEITDGNIIAESFTARPDADAGDSLVLSEGTNDGGQTFSLKVPDAGIGGSNVLCELDSAGKIPATCLSGISAGGDEVTVNGVAQTNPDFDDATPAAPAGSTNVEFQASSNNVSAAIDWGAVLDGIRQKPFYYNDFTGGQNASINREGSDLLDFAVYASGTLFQVGNTESVFSQENHPGQIAIRASATANSGGAFLTGFNGSNTSHFDLDGGEIAEFIFQQKEATGTIIRMGFHDSGDHQDPTYGIFIELDADLNAECETTNGGGANRANSAIATLTADTWYRARITVNADKTAATCQIWNDSGVSQGSATNTTHLPADNNLVNFVFGATHTAGSASTHIAWLDWMAYAFTRNLTR